MTPPNGVRSKAVKSKLDGLRRMLSKIDPAADVCPVCAWPPEVVEVDVVAGGSPPEVADPPACINPATCRGAVRQLVIEHHRPLEQGRTAEADDVPPPNDETGPRAEAEDQVELAMW